MMLGVVSHRLTRGLSIFPRPCKNNISDCWIAVITGGPSRKQKEKKKRRIHGVATISRLTTSNRCSIRPTMNGIVVPRLNLRRLTRQSCNYERNFLSERYQMNSYLTNPHDMFTICLRHVYDMFTTCLQHVYDMSVYGMFATCFRTIIVIKIDTPEGRFPTPRCAFF